MPHVCKDIGWGGEKQHPTLEKFLSGRLNSKSVCPDSSEFTVVWNLGYSQSLPYISSQLVICPMEREQSNVEEKPGIASHACGAMSSWSSFTSSSHQSSTTNRMWTFLPPFYRGWNEGPEMFKWPTPGHRTKRSWVTIQSYAFWLQI